MSSRFTRRDVLAAVSGSVGLAGCTGAGLAPDPDTDRRRTVTPAPVPTDYCETGTGPPSSSLCPMLPSNAEVYVCSPLSTGNEALQLVPGATRRSDPGRSTFVLHNGTSFPFRTGRDWWTLASRDGDTWTIEAQGAGSGRLTVPPDDTYAWVLGDAQTDTETSSIDVDTGSGHYALAITGYVAAGELTAVIAPFLLASGVE